MSLKFPQVRHITCNFISFQFYSKTDIGVTLSSSTRFDGLLSDSKDDAWLDGVQGPSNWWFAVGIRRFYYGKIPAVRPSATTTIAELFVIL